MLHYHSHVVAQCVFPLFHLGKEQTWVTAVEHNRRPTRRRNTTVDPQWEDCRLTKRRKIIQGSSQIALEWCHSTLTCFSLMWSKANSEISMISYPALLYISGSSYNTDNPQTHNGMGQPETLGLGIQWWCTANVIDSAMILEQVYARFHFWVRGGPWNLFIPP